MKIATGLRLPRAMLTGMCSDRCATLLLVEATVFTQFTMPILFVILFSIFSPQKFHNSDERHSYTCYLTQPSKGNDLRLPNSVYSASLAGGVYYRLKLQSMTMYFNNRLK